ncbi:type II toxin-antitoxin system HicB family antitoxin [Candidatus Micrarchaeota archaeon]|nr:type II toxin-antitoxin system HicB family antitoxin [Candidatus Micrarchaeota archaeon]MBI5177326.1 type II toxin-antitoxin system HicB family antitoxin [Candidatus Micrarchaeota archaeon]
MKFKVLIEKDEDGWFVARVPSLPGCISQGKTEEDAVANIREAIDLHVSSLAEEGLPLQAPRNSKTVEVAFPA